MGPTSAAAPYAGGRAAAATALVMPGTTLAHTWAGGHVPPLPALLALSALVLGASSLVLRGSLRAPLGLALVAAAQALLHGSFVATDGTGHGHHVAEAAASPWTWRMLLAHLAVTVLTSLVWQLCQRAVAVVVAAAAPRQAYAGGRRDPRPVVVTHRVPRAVCCLDVAPLRGPPVAPRRA